MVKWENDRIGGNIYRKTRPVLAVRSTTLRIPSWCAGHTAGSIGLSHCPVLELVMVIWSHLDWASNTLCFFNSALHKKSVESNWTLLDGEVEFLVLIQLVGGVISYVENLPVTILYLMLLFVKISMLLILCNSFFHVSDRFINFLFLR